VTFVLVCYPNGRVGLETSSCCIHSDKSVLYIFVKKAETICNLYCVWKSSLFPSLFCHSVCK